MNQGATELMLALGLEGSMVGTAYLDDAIWPKYAAEYAQIPVLSSSYPDETTIMAQSPDFIVGAYSSAFRAEYTVPGGTRGIYTNATVGPCVGAGSEWGQSWTTCRPQLHAAGIGTYLFEESCEAYSLRPTRVTVETVYDVMRVVGSIFNVDVQPRIDDMKADFAEADGLVSTGMSGSPLKTVWIDCVGRCCQPIDGHEQVFVGASEGTPQMLMEEAGLHNVFSKTRGSWACVRVSEIAAAQPDVLVVVDAAWDTAMSKIEYIYNHTDFCGLEAVQAARLVSLPFSASTLGPRNAPTAVDLAVSALQVRTGSQAAAKESGVASFSPDVLQTQTASLRCPLSLQQVVYGDTATVTDTTTATVTASITAATTATATATITAATTATATATITAATTATVTTTLNTDTSTATATTTMADTKVLEEIETAGASGHGLLFLFGAMVAATITALG